MDLSQLEGKKILITGATGLIGQRLVFTLLAHKGARPINVIALVRNEEKARRIFSSVASENLEFLVSDICTLKAENLNVDYIVHGANQTASKSFVEEPVDVMMTSVIGTKNILDFACLNHVKSCVYLSTMEVYGCPLSDEKIRETNASNLDTTKVRSSYPESKRFNETLCVAYQSQYRVPVKILRLTQTLGPGVSYHDARVFAEFSRCVIEGKDIVLKTKGETKRNYLFVDDAVNAILTVLLKGEDGEAYNVANEDSYCSILQMANMVAESFGEGKLKVRICETDASLSGYAPVLKMNLDCTKLRGLGWRAETSLTEAFASMIDDMKSNREK